VPNWADTARIEPRAQSATRHKLGLTDRFVVGYSGNFGRAHEFHTLVGAARLLRDDPAFLFLMTGGGVKAHQLQQAVAQERLTSFLFQEYQPAEVLSDSLAAADIHLVSLLPELEGLIVPSKVYGILAAGRPVLYIGDPDGDVGRMIREHSCGICVSIGESARLAAQLRSLRDDPSRLAAMGRNARRLALERYTSEHAVAAWLAFLDAIAPAMVRRTEPELKYAR
jgi:glycosyltransferase involved in cell wall biosynthesis